MVEKMVGWYVMHSKPQKEQFLFNQLRSHRIETYLPMLHTHTTGKARPFFPGYLFICVDVAITGISELLWIPGSKGVVCYGGTPANVPEQFIEQLKHKMETIESEPALRKMPYKHGDMVRLCSGPFEGYQAVFNQYLPEQDRVRLLLKTLAENSVYLEVPAAQLTSQ